MQKSISVLNTSTVERFSSMYINKFLTQDYIFRLHAWIVLSGTHRFALILIKRLKIQFQLFDLKWFRNSIRSLPAIRFFFMDSRILPWSFLSEFLNLGVKNRCEAWSKMLSESAYYFFFSVRSHVYFLNKEKKNVKK